MKGDTITIQHISGGENDPPTLTLSVLAESPYVIQATAGSGQLRVNPLFTVLPDGTLVTGNDQHYRIVMRNGISTVPLSLVKPTVFLLTVTMWTDEGWKTALVAPCASHKAAVKRLLEWVRKENEGLGLDESVEPRTQEQEIEEYFGSSEDKYDITEVEVVQE